VRPWIGITTYTEEARWGNRSDRATLLPFAYAESVNRAGGRAVLIPTDDSGADTLDRLDGLVIAGGSDVDPARYGEQPHPRTAWQAERDTAEFVLLQAAIERDLPVLGICRGMQLMAVAYGGRLYQHLHDHLGHDGHRPTTEPGAVTRYGQHTVRLVPGSRLHGLLGDEVVVNSMHHQGVADPGRLTPVGTDPRDGLIEAVEDPDRRFVVGVQWHPEQMADLRPFELLIAATRVDSPA
jgi:putative glutamine amidotransferase